MIDTTDNADKILQDALGALLPRVECFRLHQLANIPQVFFDRTHLVLDDELVEVNSPLVRRFHIEPSDNWFTSSQSTVIIDDLIAHDDEAWRSLIGHLFAQDILHRAVFPSRPVDDP